MNPNINSGNPYRRAIPNNNLSGPSGNQSQAGHLRPRPRPRPIITGTNENSILGNDGLNNINAMDNKRSNVSAPKPRIATPMPKPVESNERPIYANQGNQTFNAFSQSQLPLGTPMMNDNQIGGVNNNQAANFMPRHTSGHHAPVNQPALQGNQPFYGIQKEQSQYQANPQQQFQSQGFKPQSPNGSIMSDAFGQFGLGAAANPLLSVGLQQTQQYMDQTLNQFSPGVHTFWDGLKLYFHVDNYYIFNKIKLLVFPFLKSRESFIPPHLSIKNEPKTPRSGTDKDLASFDLYLPIMAFITYILCYGYIKGRSRTFSPDLLGETFSSSLTLIILQLAMIIGGNFVLGGEGGKGFKYQYLELFSLLGYKFVGIVLVILLGILLEDGTISSLPSNPDEKGIGEDVMDASSEGSVRDLGNGGRSGIAGHFLDWMYYVAVVYTALCSAYYVFKVVKGLMDVSSQNQPGSQQYSNEYGQADYGYYGAPSTNSPGSSGIGKRQSIFLITLAIIEGLVVVYLGYIPEITSYSVAGTAA